MPPSNRGVRSRRMAQQDFEIVGISLFGPSPLGEIHLRWESRFTVLYGLNGAGKTALLTAISDLFAGDGTGGDAFLHLRLPGPMDGRSTRLEADDAIHRALAQELAEDIEQRGLNQSVSVFMAPPREDWTKLRQVSSNLSELLKLSLRIEFPTDDRPPRNHHRETDRSAGAHSRSARNLRRAVHAQRSRSVRVAVAKHRTRGR